MPFGLLYQPSVECRTRRRFVPPPLLLPVGHHSRVRAIISLPVSAGEVAAAEPLRFGRRIGMNAGRPVPGLARPARLRPVPRNDQRYITIGLLPGGVSHAL